MILPPELQKYIYVLDDSPGAVEAIVRYCADMTYRQAMGSEVEAAFGLDVPDTKTGETVLTNGHL